MKKYSYLIVGMGRFGSSVAEQLTKYGHEILCVDSDRDRVQSLSNQFTNIVTADATDESALREIGAQDFNVAIVAINALQPSILITISLLKLNVEQVIAKASDTRHGEILRRLGCKIVIYPERESGYGLADKLMVPGLLQLNRLTQDYYLMEIACPPKLVGKTLSELELRQKYGVNVIYVIQQDKVCDPDPQRAFLSDDKILLTGKRENMNRFTDKYCDKLVL